MGFNIESPTQILTRHIIFLFSCILLIMHITLGVYYFASEGSSYESNIGFLQYVKLNFEVNPIKSVQLKLQVQSSKIKSIADQPVYRWSGNTAGYLCNDSFQTTECASTDTVKLEVLETSPKEFFFVPVKLNGETYAGTFEVQRCADSLCSTQNSDKISLGITKNVGTLSFTEITNSDTTYTAIYQVLIGGQELLYDSDNLFYSLGIGSSSLCYNKKVNSILPSSMNFKLYNSYSGCDRFSTIANLTVISQAASTETTIPSLNLDIEAFYRENEMSLAFMDAGLSFPKETETLSLFMVPKIHLSDSTLSSICTVIDDLNMVPSYADFIQYQGKVMFIIKQILIVILFPIPLAELAMGLMKNPAVSSIGIGSKIMCIIMLICFIVEGLIARFKYQYKADLINRIRILGWKSCFTDSELNDNLAHFPSLFTTSQDYYNYIVDIYMLISFVGLFILILLFTKMGIDVFVATKKKYGEYDVQSENEEDKLEKSQFEYKYNNNTQPFLNSNLSPKQNPFEFEMNNFTSSQALTTKSAKQLNLKSNYVDQKKVPTIKHFKNLDLLLAKQTESYNSLNPEEENEEVEYQEDKNQFEGEGKQRLR